MDLQQVARGLWRWPLTHPESERPEREDSPADWDGHAALERALQ